MSFYVAEKKKTKKKQYLIIKEWVFKDAMLQP